LFFFFPEDLGTKNKTILWTVGGNTAITAWHMAVHPASTNQSYRLVNPSVEQRCIITFLVKKKLKPAEIIRRLNAQYVEETESCAGVLWLVQ
jgi:hypothetical protein